MDKILGKWGMGKAGFGGAYHITINMLLLMVVYFVLNAYNTAFDIFIIGNLPFYMLCNCVSIVQYLGVVCPYL